MKDVIKAAIVVATVSLAFACASSPPEPASNPSQDRAKAIVQGGADLSAPPPSSQAQSAPAQANPPKPAAQAASADQPPPAPGQLTPEEQAYLQNYLSRLNYMVYYNADAKIDPRLAKAAVSQANRYLIEKQGLSVIDFDQIEKNKKDQQTAYQKETGGSIDIIQYLAQKFNADVYVELDFALSQDSRDNGFSASAQGSMKIFDTSTATLMGSVVFTSRPSFSPNSAEAAATNAVEGSIWLAMPKLVDQSKQLIQNSLARGIRYEIVIQKTPDSRQISQLRRALAKKMREVEQVSYSADATKLNIYTFQSGDKVEDAIYDAGAAAGLNDLNLVYSRGKSLTFDSGL